jgi:hypothetical protein
VDPIETKARCVVGGHPLPPQELADSERFVEKFAATVKGQAGRLVLFALPSHTHAEIQASAGKDIDRSGRFGQHNRAAQGGDENIGPEPNPAGPPGHDGESGKRLEPMAVRSRWLPSTGLTTDLGTPVLPEPFSEYHMV